jgi:hypothetical protein
MRGVFMWICTCDLIKVETYLQIKIKMDLVHSRFAFRAYLRCEYKSGCRSTLLVCSLEYVHKKQLFVPAVIVASHSLTILSYPHSIKNL